MMGQGLFDRVASIWRQLIEGYGMRLHMEDIVAEGDLVAVRYTETGTFKAAAFGREPTGKSYQLVAMELFEIEVERSRDAGEPGTPPRKRVNLGFPRLSSGVARSQTPDPQEGLRLSRQNSCRGPMPGLRPGNVGSARCRSANVRFWAERLPVRR